jgi:hypothetical protein
MAKANKRLRSVVEGAMEATKDARRAAAAEKIRSAVAAPASPPSAPAAPPPTPPPPAKPTPKPRRARAKPTEPAVEPDTRLEGTAEQRVPPMAPRPPQMTAEQAQQLRDTMLQSSRPKRTSSTKPKPAKPEPPTPKPAPGGFAPIRGPGALLGRLLKETYRQAPNIAANAVAIPAFTAAGAGGVYLGTAGTVAAIRGIGRLLAPPEEQKPAQEPRSLPAPASQPDDYRSGFQRAIDERRKPRTTDSGFDVIRGLSRTRGTS